MNTNKKTLSILIAAAGVAAVAFTLSTSSAAKKPTTSAAPPAPGATGTDTEPAPSAPAPVGDDTIQIALLLDTSGSMSGLINQARTQLWKIVNEMAEAKRDGKRPRIELALYEYGKPSLGAENGYLRQIVPLSRDLDRVSEELFALATSGGDEYAGQVIRAATQQLEWSAKANDLKLIFIAGNEGFDQGPVAYRSAIADARERGIIVNTIYCGGADDAVHQGWRDGALAAGGRSLHIDHNQAIVHIAAPQDADIAQLGARLNETYLGYGDLGMANEMRQVAQDGNAHMSGSMVARSVSKASSVYSNPEWDLLDGLESGTVTWDKLAKDDMPQEVRDMSTGERKAYVEGKRKERAELQVKIRDLNLEREKFLTAKRAEMGDAAGNTLDAAILDVLGDLAEGKGYEIR